MQYSYWERLINKRHEKNSSEVCVAQPRSTKLTMNLHTNYVSPFLSIKSQNGVKTNKEEYVSPQSAATWSFRKGTKNNAKNASIGQKKEQKMQADPSPAGVLKKRGTIYPFPVFETHQAVKRKGGILSSTLPLNNKLGNIGKEELSKRAHESPEKAPSTPSSPFERKSLYSSLRSIPKERRLGLIYTPRPFYKASNKTAEEAKRVRSVSLERPLPKSDHISIFGQTKALVKPLQEKKISLPLTITLHRPEGEDLKDCKIKEDDAEYVFTAKLGYTIEI